jgi:hypothetical protein
MIKPGNSFSEPNAPNMAKVDNIEARNNLKMKPITV